MNINHLVELNADFRFFTERMTAEVKDNFFVKRYHIGELIHSKGEKLDYFGILVKGKTRVINEFENGNVYMLETNPAIDFIGEVTILARQPLASVTIEAAEECVVFGLARRYAEKWIFSDIDILGLISSRVAYKLYRNSLNRGMRLFYPSEFIFLDYLIKEGSENDIRRVKTFKINKTRLVISEEIGMNIKTLNRVVAKLKDKGYFLLNKGKIVITEDSIAKSTAYIDSLKSV